MIIWHILKFSIGVWTSWPQKHKPIKFYRILKSDFSRKQISFYKTKSVYFKNPKLFNLKIVYSNVMEIADSNLILVFTIKV